MNINAARWVVLLALVVATAAAIPAEPEYEEYEDEAPAPVAPAKPLRPSPLLRTARGPTIGRPAPKAAVTPKPTTEAPAAPEYEDEEFEEVAADGEEPVTTTTEAPKKGGVRTGVVRPFRSNADLIETLKRRRQQQGSGGQSAASAPAPTTTSAAPEKAYKPSRRGGKGSSAPADQTGSNSERLSTVNNNSGSRRFSTRSRTTEAPVEPEVEEEQPARSRVFGRGRRF